MTYGNTNCVGTRLSLSSNNFCVSNSRRSEKYLERLRTARTATVWHWTHTAVCPLLLSDVKIGTFQQQQYCCPFQNEFGMCQKASSTKFDDKPGQPCSVCGMWTDRQTDRQTDRHVAASNTGHNAQPDNSYGALRSLSIDTHVSPQTLLNRFTRNFIYRKSSVTYILVSIKRPNRR